MAVGHTGQRSYLKAEKELLRALQIREAALGREHPIVAASYEDLAVVYLRASHVKEAEASLLKALAIREKAVGPVHPSASALTSGFVS